MINTILGGTYKASIFWEIYEKLKKNSKNDKASSTGTLTTAKSTFLIKGTYNQSNDDIC